jgi:hypothetical protein
MTRATSALCFDLAIFARASWNPVFGRGAGLTFPGLPPFAATMVAMSTWSSSMTVAS